MGVVAPRSAVSDQSPRPGDRPRVRHRRHNLEVPRRRRLAGVALAALVQLPFAAVLASALDVPVLAGVAVIAAFGLVVSYPYARRGALAAVGSSVVVGGAYAVAAYAASGALLPWT